MTDADGERVVTDHETGAPTPSLAASGSVEPPSASVEDRSVRRLVRAWAVLAVLSAVMLVLIAYFGINTISGYRLENDRAEALAAGRQSAINLTTFDFTTAEVDVQRLKDSTTSTFANGFAFDKNEFIKTLRDGKIKMRGEPTEAGLLDYNGDIAHVLVAVKAQVGNAAKPEIEPRNYRMNVTVVKRDGKWLADAAEFVS